MGPAPTISVASLTAINLVESLYQLTYSPLIPAAPCHYAVLCKYVILENIWQGLQSSENMSDEEAPNEFLEVIAFEAVGGGGGASRCGLKQHLWN